MKKTIARIEKTEKKLAELNSLLRKKLSDRGNVIGFPKWMHRSIDVTEFDRVHMMYSVDLEFAYPLLVTVTDCAFYVSGVDNEETSYVDEFFCDDTNSILKFIRKFIVNNYDKEIEMVRKYIRDFTKSEWMASIESHIQWMRDNTTLPLLGDELSYTDALIAYTWAFNE